MGPQLYPVPGTINPINELGSVSPVTGFRALRLVPVHGNAPMQVGRYSTGGLPPQAASNRSNEKADASPPPCSAGAHFAMRRPISSVILRRTFQVSWMNHCQVYWRRLSGTRPIDSE